MIRENGITRWKPSAYAIQRMREGKSKPFYWPSGGQVKPDEVSIGRVYLVDESSRTIVTENAD